MYIPCSSCFGVGTPHPTDATPLTVTATFLDLGETYNFVNDNNWDYQCGTAPAGFINLYVNLCGVISPIASYLVLNPGFGPIEQVELTIQNCYPYVATGTTSVGRVVVTGNY